MSRSPSLLINGPIGPSNGKSCVWDIMPVCATALPWRSSRGVKPTVLSSKAWLRSVQSASRWPSPGRWEAVGCVWEWVPGVVGLQVAADLVGRNGKGGRHARMSMGPCGLHPYGIYSPSSMQQVGCSLVRRLASPPIDAVPKSPQCSRCSWLCARGLGALK